MKNIFKLMAMLALVCCLSSCSDDDEPVVPTLDVTPANLNGTWQLAEWNGTTLAEGSYVYIEFTRKDQLFTMYQNLDSFSARKLTGRYDITTDVELGAIIMGAYDYGIGDWGHRYIVSDIYSLKFIEFYDTRRREMCDRIIKDTFMYDLFKAVAIERFAP